MPSFDEAQRWVANNGFAVVIALLLLGLLRYVIIDAVAHFNRRLDDLTRAQMTAVRDLSGSIEHLDRTLDKVAAQAAANHEALSNVMLFISHTQQEIVAHRMAAEAGSPTPIPSPPIVRVPPVAGPP